MDEKFEPNVIVVNYKDDTKTIIKALAVTRAVLLTAAAYLTFKKALTSFKKKENNESKGE